MYGLDERNKTICMIGIGCSGSYRWFLRIFPSSKFGRNYRTRYLKEGLECLKLRISIVLGWHWYLIGIQFADAGYYSLHTTTLFLPKQNLPHPLFIYCTMSSPYQNALSQLERAFSYLSKELSPTVLDGLQKRIGAPDRVLEARLTIRMDNGSLESFTAYRSQHSSARGPYKGGIRFHTQVSRDEVMALSLWMSLKTAVLDLPLGGGKGGIIVDPKLLSPSEIERLSRAYVEAMYPILGADRDVPAPDVNTTSAIMAYMSDEYNRLAGRLVPAAFTGKPLAVGGSLLRDRATALGGFFVLMRLMAARGESIAGRKVIIQGSGNAGLHFARMLVSVGAILVGIADSRGAIYSASGLDLDAIETLKRDKKSVTDLTSPTIQAYTSEALLEQPCDILVPAALENQITKDNAERVQASTIVELANGPTTPEADSILHSRGVVLIPDILANA